jgi:hypothetical protein
MVDQLVNMSELTQELIKKLTPSLEPLITIFQYVGIALIVYILFLIIRAIFRWKATYEISKMSKNVEEINSKLGVLIEKVDSLLSKKENIKKIKK